MEKSAQSLFKQNPARPPASDALENHHAHSYLGNLYLSLGDLAQAEVEYSRAYAFLPSPEIKSKLGAIRKRRFNQRLSAGGSDSATLAAISQLTRH